MPDHYEKRGEIVSSDDSSFTLNGTKYRISVTVRHRNHYLIHVSLLKIRGATPHDRLKSQKYNASDESDVEAKVNDGVEKMRDFAEEREDAKQLDVAVEVGTDA